MAAPPACDQCSQRQGASRAELGTQVLGERWRSEDGTALPATHTSADEEMCSPRQQRRTRVRVPVVGTS